MSEFDEWVDMLETDLADLVEKLRLYRDTLGYYANREHYTTNEKDEAICIETGELARKALGDE